MEFSVWTGHGRHLTPGEIPTGNDRAVRQSDISLPTPANREDPSQNMRRRRVTVS